MAHAVGTGRKRGHPDLLCRFPRKRLADAVQVDNQRPPRRCRGLNADLRAEAEPGRERCLQQVGSFLRQGGDMGRHPGGQARQRLIAAWRKRSLRRGDHVPVGASVRIVEHVVQPGLDLRADHVLHLARLVVHVRKIHLEDVGEEPFRQAETANDLRRDLQPGPGQAEAVGRRFEVSLVLEALQHLRGRRSGDPHRFGDPRGGDAVTRLRDHEHALQVHLGPLDLGDVVSGHGGHPVGTDSCGAAGGPSSTRARRDECGGGNRASLTRSGDRATLTHAGPSRRPRRNPGVTQRCSAWCNSQRSSEPWRSRSGSEVWPRLISSTLR